MRIEHPCYRKYAVGHTACLQCNLRDSCLQETVKIRRDVLIDVEFMSFMDQFKDYDPEHFVKDSSLQVCLKCNSIWLGPDASHQCSAPKKDY